jgi:hypothetical protein
MSSDPSAVAAASVAFVARRGACRPVRRSGVRAPSSVDRGDAALGVREVVFVAEAAFVVLVALRARVVVDFSALLVRRDRLRRVRVAGADSLASPALPLLSSTGASSFVVVGASVLGRRKNRDNRFL